MFSFDVAVAGLELHRDQELLMNKQSCSSGFDNLDAVPLDDTLCSRNVVGVDDVVVVDVGAVIGGFEVGE